MTDPTTTTAMTNAHDEALLEMMIRIRRFEETCARLYSETKIRGFVHLYIGEEAIAAGVMSVLRPEDAVVSTYREHGHALARGLPLDAVMAEMYGRVTGSSRGRGGSMHIFDTSRRFYGGNAIVAGGLPVAVGLALADKMRGHGSVTACFFGDGAAAEGEFHECMNLASLWRLPVVFLCENNRYAMGTAVERALSVPDVALRAAGYGMPAWQVDGMDVHEVERMTRRAVDLTRAGAGPTLLELQTYRFRAHSMYDPDRYRSKAEIEQWRRRDPIDLLTAVMRESDPNIDERRAALEKRVSEEIAAAVEAAEAAPLEAVEDLERFVYSEAGVS